MLQWSLLYQHAVLGVYAAVKAATRFGEFEIHLLMAGLYCIIHLSFMFFIYMLLRHCTIILYILSHAIIVCFVDRRNTTDGSENLFSHILLFCPGSGQVYWLTFLQALPLLLNSEFAHGYRNSNNPIESFYSVLWQSMNSP